ncbi:hypothetical protein BTHERMOSOX_1835 [Bathymodiolus thermophilus thioautotrophic gill symbiont]|uniref:Uncharacterized protein n=2 Tax=Bathymodiolus thermophilus thioautotrophic gill symbiont TaxID=2360 RepID=A0A8H8XAD0_9GAMM|nr:hypothetical protein THERMOS_499 [Bathymodiolus thermophilus thioautotrophic gill symbiont]SGZ92116.1 hypothetical protein BTHERMOSOX_1835 [Bathymodiolus thermophilus thioautotrophic gill symbiont]
MVDDKKTLAFTWILFSIELGKRFFWLVQSWNESKMALKPVKYLL